MPVTELGRRQLEHLVGAAERHAAHEQHPAGRDAVADFGHSRPLRRRARSVEPAPLPAKQGVRQERTRAIACQGV